MTPDNRLDARCIECSGNREARCRDATHDFGRVSRVVVGVAGIDPLGAECQEDIPPNGQSASLELRLH